MQRRLVDAAARVGRGSSGQQALQALFSTGTAAAVAGGEAAAAAPLLRAAARLPATPVGLRALLPAAARVSCSGGACWRPAAGPGSAAVVGAAAGRRGYATMGTKAPKSGYKPPPEMQRAMQMRLSMVSSNLLAEPFRGVPPSQPVTAYFTIGGWKQVWRRFLAHAKSLYTLAKTKKAIPGFSKDQFKGEALTLYKQVCGLLAAGDKTELRQLVTPAVFSDMKRQLKQREDGGWARVHWEITQEPTARELTVMQGRLIMIDPKDDTTGFSQLTVRVPSKQRFAAFNAVGKLVAGSLEQEIDVEDYWVFEHSMKPAATNRWRLAGRLSILPHAVEQRQQPAGAQQQGSDAAAQQQQQQQQQQKQQPAAEGAITARMGHIAEQQQQQQHSGKPARRRATAGRGRR